MERYAWKGEVLPGKMEEYRRRHDAIWPEMKELFRNAGIRNYSIWAVGNELFGYYECDSVQEATYIQALSPVSKRWKEYMRDVIVLKRDPSTGAQPKLQQVFLFE